MKITILNASPKAENSVSQQLIERMLPYLADEEYGILALNAQMDENFAVNVINASDAVILVAPVYMAGLPSSAVAGLDLIEAKFKKKDLKVSAVLHSGNYEKQNTVPALDLVRHWCTRNGYTYIGGVGIGGGEIISAMTKLPMEYGPFRRLDQAYTSLVQSLKDGAGKDTCFSILGPRWFYMHWIRRHWKKEAKKNGITSHELSQKAKRPY